MASLLPDRAAATTVPLEDAAADTTDPEGQNGWGSISGGRMSPWPKTHTPALIVLAVHNVIMYRSLPVLLLPADVATLVRVRLAPSNPKRCTRPSESPARATSVDWECDECKGVLMTRLRMT